MIGPRLYVLFPGTAREALQFYEQTFGGELALYSYEQFNRSDGPPSAIAHGELTGDVSISGADVAEGEPSVKLEGVMLALLGAAEPPVLHAWFEALAVGGTVLDPLAVKPWGAVDGQVVDRHGLRWLIGYEPATSAD